MPTRYLKPGIRDSEAIDLLSPVGETMFCRLLVTVDDFGRTDARPAMVKANCYPIKKAMTEDRCAATLQELAQAGLVDLYRVDGKPYLQMRKWDNHPRAAASKFPAPPHGCAQVHTSADGPRTSVPVTVTETGTDNRNRKPEHVAGGDDGDFEQAWGLYPSRPGNSKADAKKAWHARIKEGVKAFLLIDGTKRYADYCAAMHTEPRFIKQAATFYGPGHHYRDEWALPQQPTSKQDALEQRNAQTAARVLADMKAAEGEKA
jgi:hypothetical protein